ncbi:MAG: cytochrome c biogenesis protein CcsA [Planctomycetota bacterium]
MPRPTRLMLMMLACVLFLAAVPVHAEQPPSTQPAVVVDNRAAIVEDRTAFIDAVDVEPVKRLSVQDRQTLKTFDTFARERIADITGKRRIDGQEPVFTVLDMAYRPELYAGRNLIKVRHLPLRLELAELPMLSDEQADRLRKEGTISLLFFVHQEVQEFLENQQASAVHKADAINRLGIQAAMLDQLLGAKEFRDRDIFPPVALIPPTDEDDQIWKRQGDVVGNVSFLVGARASVGLDSPPPVPGYDEQRLEQVMLSTISLMTGWARSDAAAVNAALEQVGSAVPAVVPERYPSETKRNAELLYNRYGTSLGMIFGSALYLGATVFLLMASRILGGKLRIAGLVLFVAAFALHTAAIGIRWWLVEKSHGDWFHAIPIKNQFESVMFSAWFGALIGLILELWKGKGLFAAAAGFVGALSLMALFTVPFVFNKEIGGQIGQVQGVLMSYWLYIHVTVVVASYALIGMSFAMGAAWLFGRFALRRTLPQLAALDQCHVVVLQLAFWLLGIGIIFGAVWADMSWGRPWGWDPKETFALVTWIVYLIIVHVRIITPKKALWTSSLAIIGFAIMLFNWIGVNYFMVGLHSYA